MATPDGTNSVAITFQFVVVAVVACGIFSAGVITVMYRRRRAMARLARGGGAYVDTDRLEWGFRRRPNGGDEDNPTRLVLAENGMFVEVPVKKRPKLGPEPKVWDAQMGHWQDVKEEVPHAWHPVSVAIPPPEQPDPNPFATPAPPSAASVDVTVLIAMPDPSLHYTPEGYYYTPAETKPSQAVYDEDDFEIPNIQLGTAAVSLSASIEELDAFRPEPVPPSPPEGRVRRVRVDGFSGRYGFSRSIMRT